MSWLDDQDIKTHELMREVSDYQKWNDAAKAYDERRFQAMRDHAMKMAGFLDPLVVVEKPDVIDEGKVNRKLHDKIMAKYAKASAPIDRSKFPMIRGLEGPFRFKSGRILYYDPKAGAYYDKGKDMYLDRNELPESLDEDKRSDSEFSMQFPSATDALSALKMAVDAGLVEGEVEYDDEGSSRGVFSLRFAPHVKITKSDVMLRFARAMREYLTDPLQHEDYDSLLDELVEVTASEKKGAKKLSQKKRKERYREYNALHGHEKGKFRDKEELKNAGKGSFSHLDQKRKVGKSKKGGFQMQMTKRPCGRDARGKDVPDSKKYTRCWDGEKGYPWPSSKVG